MPNLLIAANCIFEVTLNALDRFDVKPDEIPLVMGYVCSKLDDYTINYLARGLAEQGKADEPTHDEGVI